MLDHIKNILENAPEIPFEEASWDQLQTQLDATQSSDNAPWDTIATTLQNPPPVAFNEAAWEALATQLPSEKKRKRPLLWYCLGALLGLGALLWYINSDDKNKAISMTMAASNETLTPNPINETVASKEKKQMHNQIENTIAQVENKNQNNTNKKVDKSINKETTIAGKNIHNSKIDADTKLDFNNNIDKNINNGNNQIVDIQDINTAIESFPSTSVDTDEARNNELTKRNDISNKNNITLLAPSPLLAAKPLIYETSKPRGEMAKFLHSNDEPIVHKPWIQVSLEPVFGYIMADMALPKSNGYLYGADGRIRLSNGWGIRLGLQQSIWQYEVPTDNIKTNKYALVLPFQGRGQNPSITAHSKALQLPVGLSYQHDFKDYYWELGAGIINRKLQYQRFDYQYSDDAKLYYLEKTYSKTSFTRNTYYMDAAFGKKITKNMRIGLSLRYAHDFQKNIYEYEHFKQLIVNTSLSVQF